MKKNIIILAALVLSFGAIGAGYAVATDGPDRPIIPAPMLGQEVGVSDVHGKPLICNGKLATKKFGWEKPPLTPAQARKLPPQARVAHAYECGPNGTIRQVPIPNGPKVRVYGPGAEPPPAHTHP